MTVDHPSQTGLLRRTLAALVEALPALLLAVALLGPALAALAGPTPERPADLSPGLAIAQQGNRALLAIRDDAREASRHMAPPALPAYAAGDATDAREGL